MEAKLMVNLLSASLWAWEFLRRNPKYQSDYSRFHPEERKALDHPFPLLRQVAIDQEAVKWGLLAYENPDIPARRAMPFWAIGSTLEADVVSNGDEPLLTMLRKTRTRVSGIQLLGGALVLTLEQDSQSMQILLRDGRSFDETCNVNLRLPVNFSLPVQIVRSLSFWSLVTGKQVKKITAAVAQISQSTFKFLTA